MGYIAALHASQPAKGNDTLRLKSHSKLMKKPVLRSLSVYVWVQGTSNGDTDSGSNPAFSDYAGDTLTMEAAVRKAKQRTS